MAEKVVSVRLLARVEGFTAGMRKARASVDELTKAKVPAAAKGYSDLANKAALAGTAIAVGLGVAVKRFADFDKAMSAVKANSGATGAELERLRASAIKLGADSQFSATEAAQGINELAKAGVATQSILGGGLKGALDLAAAGQIEVAAAAEVTASALTQFGLKGDSAVHVADLLASGANKAQGGVGDLGAALNQAGLVAASTGLSIEETAAGLTAFASAGLIGSDAGTSFKTMLQRLSAPSGKAAETLKELGISAYDSQGNFVGLANVAEQLKKGMQDLAPAQRNAAMATIFGSDAIRASNILYEQGADGINKWIDAVDDQGAAAKQAATLTDNLSGDIERLGGAFDSVLIQTGSGANASLRSLVQGLQGMIESVGKIPGPLLLAGAGISAIALLAPKGIIAFREYKASLDAITQSAPRAGRALNGFANAAAIGAAVFVTAQAFDALGKELAELRGIRPEGVESAKSAILDGGDAALKFKDALDLTTGALSKVDTVANNLVLPTRLLGGSMEVTKDSVKSYDQALADLVSSGNGEKAAAFIAAAGLSAKEAKDLLPQYADSLAGVGNQAKLAGGSSAAFSVATEDVTTAAEDAAEATNNFVEALKGLNQPTLDLREAQRQVQEALQGTKDVVGDVRDKLIEKATADGKSEEAAKKWADAQLKAGEALNKNRTEFDITTEAGRAYQESLDTLAGTYQTQIDKLAETGAAQGTLDSRLTTSREELYKTAVRMGLSQEAARLYVEQVLAIPPAASTTVTVKTSAAAAAVDAIQRKINGLQGKDVRIGVRYNEGGRDQTGGITKADGGAIYGKGTGRSDSIAAWLSNGEHVLTAAEVSKLGGQSAVYALRRAINDGWRPGFANGGAVAAPRYAPPVQYMAGGPTSYSTRNDYGLNAEQVTIVTPSPGAFARELRTAPYRAKARPR